MSNHPIWCSEQDDVSRALDLMKTHQIRRLPVVNEKHEVVGLLSFGDLVHRSGLEANAIVAALQAICEPALVPQQDNDEEDHHCRLKECFPRERKREIVFASNIPEGRTYPISRMIRWCIRPQRAFLSFTAELADKRHLP
jgi:hypothetical protein